MQEIHDMVFQMKKNKSPGADGFPVDFYQEFWELVKWDVKGLLDDFAERKLDIARHDYGTITIVPKTDDAKEIQKFRPICLLNVRSKLLRRF